MESTEIRTESSTGEGTADSIGMNNKETPGKEPQRLQVLGGKLNDLGTEK